MHWDHIGRDEDPKKALKEKSNEELTEIIKQAQKDFIDAASFHKEISSVLIELLEELCARYKKERDDYALLLFQPCGESHHDANKCPYCMENLNGKA